MNKHDIVFLKHFSQVIAFLVGVTICLILLGIYINNQKTPDVNEAKQARIANAIAPHGAVFAGATGLAAQKEAERLANEAAQKLVAYEGRMDGSYIYQQLCAGCHTSGAGNAPKMQKAAWGGRIGQGKETLYKHAIEGYNNVGVMPARGGNPSLSDAQVKATVDWMLANLK